MDTKQFHASVKFLDPLDDVGKVSALFSVFNELDTDGDVVLPSFFTDGQTLPMAAWGHDWNSLNPGKGIVRVTPAGAVFEGAFNLKTQSGRDHYETVKFNQDLQNWSFGFRVLESDPGEFQGQDARFLKRGEIYEASPVLVGANRNARTLDIKSGQPFGGEAEAIEAALAAFVTRTQARAEMRGKSGRVLSAANRERLAAFLAALRQGGSDIEALLAATAPPPQDDGKAQRAALLDYLAFEARRLGVAI